LKPFSVITISNGIIDKMSIENHSIIESNDLLNISVFRSFFSPLPNQKCTIPPLCLICQTSTKISYFSECFHSLYCSHCFDSVIENGPKYHFDDKFSCKLCGLISYYDATENLDGDSLCDSDCFCLCCHSHNCHQLCYICEQIGCNRCFKYYGKASNKCLFCSSDYFLIDPRKVHIIQSDQNLSFE
jgi:hypothetical protein